MFFASPLSPHITQSCLISIFSPRLYSRVTINQNYGHTPCWRLDCCRRASYSTLFALGCTAGWRLLPVSVCWLEALLRLYFLSCLTVASYWFTCYLALYYIYRSSWFTQIICLVLHPCVIAFRYIVVLLWLPPFLIYRLVYILISIFPVIRR